MTSALQTSQTGLTRAETRPDTGADQPDGAEYYRSGCGVPYERSPIWLRFFGGIADSIVQTLAPRTVFDAGCGCGFLVEALWDRGVVAHGRDVSGDAIAQARPDMRGYVSVGCVTEPIAGPYDLITCLDLLEHMPAEKRRLAVRQMTEAADTILFSSTPEDFNGPTDVNVQPPLYWLELFNEFSFAPDPFFDARFLTRHAILFRRRARPLEGNELAFYARHLRLSQDSHRTEERLRGEIQACSQQLIERDRQLAELRQAVALREQELAAVRVAAEQQVEQLRGALDHAQARITGVLSSRSWQATAPLRAMGRLARRFARMVPRMVQVARPRRLTVVPEPLVASHPWFQLTTSETILSLQDPIDGLPNGLPRGWIILSCRLDSAGDARRLAILAAGPAGPARLVPVRLGMGTGMQAGCHRFLTRLPDAVSGLALDIVTAAPQAAVGEVAIREIGGFAALVQMGRSLLADGGIRSAPALLASAVRVYRREGLTGVRRRMGGEQPRLKNEIRYHQWLQRNDKLGDADRVLIRAHIARLSERPLISVILPVYNPRHEDLRAAIESVRQQLYPHWELCIADDRSTDPEVGTILTEYASMDSRIKVVWRPVNGHISAASNSALALAEGAFIALLDQDDLLAEHALYMVAELIDRHPDAVLIYSDEDKIDAAGKRFEAYFKPDWNPELILGQNYFSHLGVYRRSAVAAVGGFRQGYEGSQDYDLLLRVAETTSPRQIHHIPHILYHWRAIPGSTAFAVSEKDYAHLRGRQAVRDHLARRGIAAEVLPSRSGIYYRVRYPLPDPAPKVSLIVPTRDRLELLQTCVTGLLEGTDYPNLEVLVVDNDSSDPATLGYFERLGAEPRVRVIPYRGEFNYSAINNCAAAAAAGDIIGLINNDIEIIHRDWLTELVSQLCRDGVGAVGAMLYYPTDTIQHAGVILGASGVANHAHLHLPRGTPGYFGRAELAQQLSAVTGACMLVHRHIYQALGGLNEQDLKIAFNDVDFCIRMNQAGYRIIWTPYAELYHHESASRGRDFSPEKKLRFKTEAEYMRRTWAPFLDHDPFYNLNLSLIGFPYDLGLLSRAPKPWRV